MNARIINNEDFGGLYTTQFIDDNWDNVINGELVSDWVFTQVLPVGEKLPKWNGSNWYEAYEEIIEVPAIVHPLRFRVALINFGIMPSAIDAAIASMPPGEQKERLFALWNFADYLERADPNLIYMASQFEVDSEQLDALFIASKQPV